MKRFRVDMPLAACLLVAFVQGCGSHTGTLNKLHNPPTGSKEVQLNAADGAKVFGYHFSDSTQPSRKVVLCFHQANSSAWEYESIAPRFVKLGWDALAIDQRSGGQMFGHPNRTEQAYGKQATYMAAYADLEAALEWAKHAQYKTIVACGSSYSASLAIKLAADHPEISGVMAFSPGEYMEKKGTVREWSSNVKAPRLYAGTKAEADEIVLSLWQAVPQNASPDQYLIADPKGIHGASTLINEKNPSSSETSWLVVTNFLQVVSPK